MAADGSTALQPTFPNRINVDGKYFRYGGQRFYVKGLSYGPFAINSQGQSLPERSRWLADLKLLQDLGANVIRLYSAPSTEILDDLQRHGLFAMIDVPWQKHRCFFEEWSTLQEAREIVSVTARNVGNHPAVLAISLVNEIPNDVVRFYGHARVERFLTELNHLLKLHAPGCLSTFANYPTTEFLQPEGFDFFSFNVYLNDVGRLGSYLDRLQHIAGDLPLLLSEFGLDSKREGEEAQAELLSDHVEAVYKHGLAGSLVFSFTDEWFTGGRLLDQWGFGVTRADRTLKPAAGQLKRAWQLAPFTPGDATPKVSVVVCAYNAARTLPECLESLRHIDYPNYEVVLVDDGSKDDTPSIASRFPEVKYVRQSNHGLSVARNVGAAQSSGDIVAYTDADCVVDGDWLRCLVQAMQIQEAEAIGGPNITPHTDGWGAQCVAASPGNPSHVMLDDCRAEHIPGCNMAFRRETLQRLGGFDPQYRQAGDDVDLCWRLLDEGGAIGYAPGGFVWHHRRETVSAFLKQQIGYGKAEALLHFKHPQRFSIGGRCSWHGRIYGSGTAGLPIVPERIYYGPFGLAPYQVIYRHNFYGMWACATWLEWHVVAAFFFFLGFLFWPLWVITLVMWSATIAVIGNAAYEAKLPPGRPWWCRPLVAVLHLVQPAIREWTRLTYDLSLWRPHLGREYLSVDHPSVSIDSRTRDLYWQSDNGLGRTQLLHEMVQESRSQKWLGVLGNAWAPWDVKLVGDLWHTLLVFTATEELGNDRRFTRARCVAEPTIINRVISIASLIWAAAALLSLSPWALAIALSASALALFQNVRSRLNCLSAITALVARAGAKAGLKRYATNSPKSATPDVVLRGPPNAPSSADYLVSPLATPAS
jgi:O-antigen biosynthesis protein